MLGLTGKSSNLQICFVFYSKQLKIAYAYWVVDPVFSCWVVKWLYFNTSYVYVYCLYWASRSSHEYKSYSEHESQNRSVTSVALFVYVDCSNALFHILYMCSCQCPGEHVWLPSVCVWCLLLREAGRGNVWNAGWRQWWHSRSTDSLDNSWEWQIQEEGRGRGKKKEGKKGGEEKRMEKKR